MLRHIPALSILASMNPTTKAMLTPLKDLRFSAFRIPAFAHLPNTSIQDKPLLIYHSAFPSSVSASSIERHLSTVGVVTPQWRDTMYRQPHFHSTAHEVLCIYSGKAKACFGGRENAHRVEAMVQSGDVVVLPAGVAHQLLEDVEGDFRMVGSYPTGTHWDMCYGEHDGEGQVKDIGSLGWFERDPIYGDEGPCLQV